MPGRIIPLRYEITDWHQLPGARSNTDPTLRIRVTDFINSTVFEGVRIQVVHPQYGIMFACCVNTSGRIPSWDPDAFLTTEQILTALRQLGFIIFFTTKPTLNSATREFLQGCVVTGYTHIRWAVRDTGLPHVAYDSEGKDYRYWRDPKKERIIICFNEDKRPELCQQCIKPIRSFDGDIMQVSVNENTALDFSWLPLRMPLYIQSILDNT